MNEKSGWNRHNHVMITSKFWFSGDFNFLICNKGWWRYWIISKAHFSKESLRITDWAFPVVHYVSDSAQTVVLAIDRYPINILSHKRMHMESSPKHAYFFCLLKVLDGWVSWWVLYSDTVPHLMSAVGQEDDQLLVQQDSSNSSFPGTDGGQIACCIHNSLNVLTVFISSLCWSRTEAEKNEHQTVSLTTWSCVAASLQHRPPWFSPPGSRLCVT